MTTPALQPTRQSTLTLQSVDISAVGEPAPVGIEEAATEAFHLLNHAHIEEPQRQQLEALIKRFPNSALARCRFHTHFEDGDKTLEDPETWPVLTLSHLAAYHNHVFALQALKASGDDLLAEITNDRPSDDYRWAPGIKPVDLARENESIDAILALYDMGYRSEDGLAVEFNNQWKDILAGMALRGGLARPMTRLMAALDAQEESFEPAHIMWGAITNNHFEDAKIFLKDSHFVLGKHAYEDAEYIREAAKKDEYNRSPKKDDDKDPRDPNAPSWVELLLRQGLNVDHQEDVAVGRDIVQRSPVAYFTVTKPNIVAVETFLKFGSNLQLVQTHALLRQDPTVRELVAEFKDQYPMIAALVERYYAAGQAVADRVLRSDADPMALKVEDIYAICNVGRAQELFTQPHWRTPQAADYGIKLIDGLIPSQQEQFAFDRAKLTRFAAQVTAPAHDGKLDAAQIVERK